MSVKIRWLVPIACLFGRRGGVAAFLEARDLFLRREFKGQDHSRASSIKHQAGPSQRAIFYVCDFYRFVQRNIFVPRATNFYMQPRLATERPVPVRRTVEDQPSWK